jgi:type II secretory ATPase GspE/PulE/Tfp pilus assembly ATPase PilB-like protein
VRKLCPSCAAPSPDADNILALLKATGADAGELLGGREPLLRRACGCSSCRNTGFGGRTTIYELLTMTPAVAGAVMGEASEADIQKIATAQGMTTMLQAGLVKALTGETTTDEVMRVARFDP